MIDPIRQQQAVDLATQLISRNTPIEAIIQQTGLPRDTVNNLVNRQLSITAPLTPVMPPQDVGGGIPTLADSEEIRASVPDNLGTDIADYLTEDLGFDGTEDDRNLTLKQMLNSANAAWMQQNPENIEGAQSLLETQKLAEEAMFDDEDLNKIYAQAAKQIYDMDYEQFIQSPDKSMPLMLFGLSLAQAGTKGEDWPTALSQATLQYFFNKRKDERSYDRALKTIGLKKQEQINDLVTQFTLLDYKNKAAINQALAKADLEAPKMYDISTNGNFTDKSTIPLSITKYRFMAENFPENVRPSTNANKEAWTIKTRSGALQNILMDQDDVNAWDPLAQDGAVLIKGHQSATNIKRYNRKGADGAELLPKWLSPDQVNFQTEQGIVLEEVRAPGRPIWATNKETGEGVFVSAEDIYRNPGLYQDNSGMSFFIDKDGNVEYSTGSARGATSRERAGRNEYDEVLTTLRSTEQALNNYMGSISEQDELLGSYLKEYPMAANIPFNNLPGNTARLFGGLSRVARDFTNFITQDYEKGGSKFTIRGADGSDKEVDFQEFRNSIINSDEFKEVLNSPLAKFLEDSEIIEGELSATMFDLAMLGAATYTPNKNGVDLRAISDFETRQFLKMQGNEAKTLASFLSIRNRFARNTISRSRNFIEQQSRPATFVNIINAANEQDLPKIEALKEEIDIILNQINEYETQVTDSYIYGFGDDALNYAKLYVADKTMDADNPDVVEYNPNIPSGYYVPQYDFTFQNPYTLSYETKEGTFRSLMNKYENTLLDKTGEKTTTLLDNLKTNLSPEEYTAFEVFWAKRPTN